ncbi:MAG: hypothetical protein ABDI20_03540 [Candidatus Bipolaricaulaceae bacterium]
MQQAFEGQRDLLTGPDRRHGSMEAADGAREKTVAYWILKSEPEEDGGREDQVRAGVRTPGTG